MLLFSQFNFKIYKELAILLIPRIKFTNPSSLISHKYRFKSNSYKYSNFPIPNPNFVHDSWFIVVLNEKFKERNFKFLKFGI